LFLQATGSAEERILVGRRSEAVSEGSQ